jgi:predicted AlkP superfamily phosphohydrolase/phosphomutase
MRKVIVIGVDCMTPQLAFDRWADEIPNLSGLRKGCLGSA